MENYFRESLKKLQNVNSFCNFFQINKNQSIYFSRYHTAYFCYRDFCELYMRDQEPHMHVYMDYLNINFEPSHLNIPIFPPWVEYIKVYTTIMENFWWNIEMVVYDQKLVPENTDTLNIGWFLFFDIFFEIEHAFRNIEFKFSQNWSISYTSDIYRLILLYIAFYKYLHFREMKDREVKITNLIVDKIFSYLDTRSSRLFLWQPWNPWKWIYTGIARVLYRERLKIQNDWFNNFNKGDIIIAHSTDVFYMKYIFDCWAIITENSNLLSHASLISRELWIPLVLGISDIFLKIFDGDLIELDADTGHVKILKRFWEK